MRPSLTAALVIIFALALAPSLARADDDAPARLDPSERGRVRIDGALWRALQPAPDTPDPPLPGPAAHVRHVELEPTADALLIRATWLLDAFEPGWFDAVLAGPELRDLDVTWNGGPAAWDSGPGGLQITGYVDGPVEVRLEAELPGDPTTRASFLNLLPALRGDVAVLLPDELHPTLTGSAVTRIDDTTWWTGGDHLELTLAEAAGPRSRATLANGAVGLGLTIADSELRGRARVRWTLRRGQLDRLALRVTGVGEDLQITGSTVRSVERSGARVLVELQAPATTSVELQLAWSARLPDGNEGSVQLPTIVLEGVARTDTSLQLARDGEWEALPDLAGWNPRAGSLLPDWGRALVEGTPTAAFLTPTPGRAGTISLLRFEPVSGPAIVVDVADHELAATAEGRLITRVRYEVVNDRGAYLELLPPFGSSFLTVRVDEEPVVPVRAGGAWRIPLPRSLETVSGLISVPVEVVLLSEGEPWGRRETRELTLPQVNAPIAASRVTLYLPPGYREAPRNDDSRRVESFSEGEGISWGFLAEDEDARDMAEHADLVFKQAADAWLGNEFDEAQQHLDVLAEMGATNFKTDQLQSNLDVVFEPEETVMHGEAAGYGTGSGSSGYGSSSGSGGGVGFDSANAAYDKPASGKSGRRSSSTRSSGEEALRRRIRDQARARGEDEYREYESTRREAERALQEGDYKAAEEQFRRAREVGSKLQYYEQEESEEISQLNFEIDRQLAEVTVKAEEKEKRLVEVIQAPAKKKAPKGAGPRRGGFRTEGLGAGGLGLSGHGSGGGGVGAVGASLGGAVAAPAPPVTTSRRTEIYFEDDEIEGELLLPADALFGQTTDLPDLADGRYTVDVDASGLADEDDDHFYYEPSPDPAPAPEAPRGPMGGEAIARSGPAPVTTASSTATGVTTDATWAPQSQTLQVSAATRSVPIPRIGLSLRYQQLLLPAGEAPAIVVRARLPRSEGTRP